MLNIIKQLICHHDYLDISLYYHPSKTVLYCNKCGKFVIRKKE